MDEQNRNIGAKAGLHSEAEQEWALDIMCGMEVDPTTTKYRADYLGELYYFCNSNCMTLFMNKPYPRFK